MPTQGYEELKILNRKLDDLLTRYGNIKTELEELKREKVELYNTILERDARIKELETNYERLKISGALLGDGQNAVMAKKKITELVREIDRCVALINR